MSAVCHAWLRHARTRKDSATSYEFVHEGLKSQRKFMCMNWMVFNGETP